MPPLQRARIAAVVATASALVVIAGAAIGSMPVAITGGVIAAAAGVLVIWSLSREHTMPAASVAPTPEREPVTRKRSEGTVLLATLRNISSGSERLAGDLQRVLAGIVADERGAVDRFEAETLVASFSRSDHAGAAVHAAQRMLSNVDAVSRRLGHDLRIGIGLHTGPRGEETLAVAARVRDASTQSVPVLVSETVARHLGSQLERVETVHGEGWQMDVFTFPPAQKRLPGL